MRIASITHHASRTSPGSNWYDPNQNHIGRGPKLAEEQFDEGMDFAPERWETVVEDVAQVLALGLERAEDLADVLSDLVRGRPGLPKIAAAVAVGMVLGSFAERL